MSNYQDFTKKILQQLVQHQDLQKDDAETLFSLMMQGELPEHVIAATLMGLACKGESIDEISAAVSLMRHHAKKINAPDHAMDIVGTGGDGIGTYNISTMSALVVAACGIPIAKHGNRNLSSQSGSANVLEALGINLNCDFTLLEKSLYHHNICFLMAPNHHPAMRFVMPVRQSLAIRTIFNILGPMSNPANVKNYLIGVYDKKWLQPMCKALVNLGAENAMIIHGHYGMDELSTTGDNYFCRYDNGYITEGCIHPRDADISIASLDDIIGGTPEDNAKMVHRVLQGEKNPVRDIVLLNAAAALMVIGKADNLLSGKYLAENSIDSGGAMHVLDNLITVSHS